MRRLIVVCWAGWNAEGARITPLRFEVRLSFRRNCIILLSRGGNSGGINRRVPFCCNVLKPFLRVVFWGMTRKFGNVPSIEEVRRKLWKAPKIAESDENCGKRRKTERERRRLAAWSQGAIRRCAHSARPPAPVGFGGKDFYYRVRPIGGESSTTWIYVSSYGGWGRVIRG